MLRGVLDCEVRLIPLRQSRALRFYSRLQPLQHHKHHARWQGRITLVQLDSWIANSFLQRLQLSKCVRDNLGPGEYYVEKNSKELGISNSGIRTLNTADMC